MTSLSPTALEAAAKAMEAKRAELQHAPLARIYPDLCTAAITAYLAQMEKEGWVMVPKVPTDEMDLAGSREFDRTNPYPRDVAANVYAAMLAAAQNGGEPCK